jgi:mannan endo-1,4-beta-mannosidase
VCLNGIEDTTSSNVIEMAYVSNLTWYENSSSQWFSKNNATDAWNGPQTSPLGTQPILFVSPPSGISPATPFQVVGSAANYATIPVLTFADDGGAATALPAGAVVTLTSFTFTHPGMSSGPHTLVISDGTHSTSAAYSVATAGWIALPSQSGTTLTVPGLLPGTAYDFEVFASNVAGQGPFSAILTASTSPTAVVVPGAPTGLTSTAVSTTTVSLTWTAPVVGTQPLTYQAQWSPTGLNTWTSIPVVSTTSAQVTGLVAATTYDFRVSASNTAGTSPFSAIYTVATAATVPATTFNPAGASPTVTFSNQNLTATMGGSSTPYSTPQTVVGTTGQGSGKFSFQVTLNAVTQNLSVGLANASFVFGQIGGGGSDANSVAFYPSTGAGSQGALTAYFNSSPIMNPSTFGAGDTAGAVLTFLVDVTSGLFWVTSPAMVALYGAGAWNDAPASAAMNPSNGTGGLPIGVAGALFIMVDAGEGGGRVTLNAGSSAFVGPAVIPAQFPPWGGGTIVVVAPGTVTGLAGVASPNQVALTWAVPTGTPPFTYTVQYKLHSAGTYTTFGTSTSASTTVTSLVASTSYDFRVFASNGAGSGATSAVLTLSTTATLALPGQTQGVSLSGATSNSIVVSWQAPSSGGPPTSYQVQFKLSSASTFGNFLPTVTGLTETVTGLAASTSYDFRVSATNAAGTGPFSSPAVTASTTAVGNLTAAIKAWMISLAGSQVISGQKIPGATNDLSAMNNINAQTGHFPGLIGIDYWNDGAPPGAPTYSGNTGAIQWWNAGGIITLSNMTPNPQGGGAQNITAYDPNTVVAGTAVNTAWNVIQDGIATGLAQLQAAGAVVIYRPFHENGAPGLWWWSEPTQAQFIALWQNHYNRLTVTHGLTNLLWLFSSGPQINYPGDSFVDFLGAEGYTNDPANSTNYGDMIAPPGHGKPIVLAEFGSGSPSFGDSSFDEQTLINALKNPSGIPLCIYFLNWSNSWSIDNMTNASGALNDPHVLNRDQLNRPTSGTLALPGQVTGLLASSPDPTDASLTWSVPSSGGAPASYQVQFKLSTVTTYTTFGSVSGTSSTVSGLSPGTTYNFRVRAVNSTGNGAFSAVATTTTQVVSGGGPGHGPAEFVPATPQVFTGRGNGTGPNWGNIRVSDSVFVDTQQGIPFGNITYTTMESNATAWAEFGRYGEIKNLYEGCTACFLADGIVLGPPDVPLDPSGFVYYTAGNYSGGAIIWRYAGDNGSMVINDFSAGRGDYINIRGDFQGAGVTVTYPGGDTHMVVNATGGLIYIYGVQYDPNTIAWD